MDKEIGFFGKNPVSLTWIIHKLTAKTAKSGPEPLSVLSLRTPHFFFAHFAFFFAYFAVYELFRLILFEKGGEKIIQVTDCLISYFLIKNCEIGQMENFLREREK